MAKEKAKKGGKDKTDGKDKYRDKKKGVTFAHDRLTKLPPPRYPVGQEPPLPPWPIVWTPISIILESSIPGLSLDIITEKFNKLANPSISMVVVHPKDLGEDEMVVDGTILGEMLKKAKEEEHNVAWPSSNLLDKCLKSRSALDRDNEHRKEEVRRANVLLEAKLASEDLKEKLVVAKEGVAIAESKLKAYRKQLLEEMWAKKAEKRLSNKITTIEVGEAKLTRDDKNQNNSNVKKKEQKKDKSEKEGAKDKQEEKGEKGLKKGTIEKSGPDLAPILSSQNQFKLFEEEVTKSKYLVKEVEAGLLKSMKNEATLASTLLEPFITSHLYCIIGMDSILPMIELASEDKSFFKAIFNVVGPRPKDPSISLETKELEKARYDEKETKASKKEVKATKKEAKAIAIATTTPPLVVEIKALVENSSMMEPARNICVVDVFYETPLPLDEVENTQGKKEAKDKSGKKTHKGKEEQKEVEGNEGDDEKIEKGKKDKKIKKVVGAKDESLPYKQIGQAIIVAFQRLLLQVKMYNDLGENNVRIFKIPKANNSIHGKDHRIYYDHLLNEIPQGLVTIPIIVHCLLEQVTSYHCHLEDIKSMDATNMSKQIRNDIYNEFEKPAHPRGFVELQGHVVEQQLPTMVAKQYNIVQVEAEITTLPTNIDNDSGFPDERVVEGQEEKMVDAIPNVARGHKLISNTRSGGCGLHRLMHTRNNCTIHRPHINVEDEPTLRKGQVTKAKYNPSIQAKELEENLNVTHEFDTMARLSRTLKAKSNPKFIDDSIDVTKVGQHLSMLRATPARLRYKMPGTPEYSEEKMGASLTMLQDLCDHFEDDLEPKFKTLEDALFHCKGLGGLSKLPQVDIRTMQRYKKLMIFLDMIKEDKDVFPDLDIPMEEIPPMMSKIFIKGPNDFNHMEYWCNNCLDALAKHPNTARKEEELNKQPLTDKERTQLKKEFEMKLINDYEKKKLHKDQSKDTFEQEMFEVGIFSKVERSKEEEEQDTRASSRPDLDPGVVKMWCAGCQSVFLPPPPLDLEETWREGERMRLEMKRLAEKEAQDVVDAKIEAWKRLEKKVQKSILGRRLAEGFSDTMMSEVYAQAKLHLPFEKLRYDHEEDCILSCLYAANTQQHVQEEIPCPMPFGDFCATINLDTGKLKPLKKRYAVYEMESQYKQVLDERRYLLVEQQSLITCGLPAKSFVQYEPRVTIYKDGNVVMLRAIKTEEKLGNIQEDVKWETCPESLLEGDQLIKLGKEKMELTLEKEVRRSSKARKGKEEQKNIPNHEEPVNGGDHKSVPPFLEPLSPQVLLESGRSVIACLKDGLIAVFFLAKDATLHLQINIPVGGRTFEITSTGEVIFLPFDNRQKEEPKSASINNMFASTTSPTIESTENSKKGEKREPKGQLSPQKEQNTKRDKKSNQEKREVEPKDKESEPKKKSQKDNEKPLFENLEHEGKGDTHTLLNSLELDTREDEEEGQLLNNLDFINNLHKKTIRDMEVSRCILPSGTVVSFRENGSSQILYNNGNVSEYKTISKEIVGWVTTNNRGFCVLQDPPTIEELETNDEVILAPTDQKTKDTKQKKGHKSKIAKQEKDQKTKDAKTVGQGTEQHDANQDKKKVVSFVEQDDSILSTANLAGASNPNLPPVVQVERPHMQFPSKKVVEVFDPDSGSLITTREDRVVMLNTNDKTVRVVQHADGTHIYSEVKEKIEQYNPSVGQISFHKTKEFNTGDNTTILLTSSSYPPPNDNIKIEHVHAKVENESIPAPEIVFSQTCMNQQTNTKVQPSTQVYSQSEKGQFSAQWHVRKEGFPHVHGNTNGGVAVEFSTEDGQYYVTWSRESGQISLLMPNGSMIYSHGKLVNFDASDGTKKEDPKQMVKMSLQENELIEEEHLLINTNGIYEFNLETTNLTFTDNVGNGFRSSWGYKVDQIINGLLELQPPELVENSESLSEVSEILVGVVDPKGDRGKKASQNVIEDIINCKLVPVAMNNNNGESTRATSKSKLPIQSSLVKVPLVDQSLTMVDPIGSVFESTAAPPPFVSNSKETREIEEELLVGPIARLFVIHEGGYGFEIIHGNDFKKYASSKTFRKDCTHVRQVYDEGCAILHTFVTVEQKAKKLAALDVQAQECCRAPDGLRLWGRKVSEFARRIKLRDVQTKLQKRTKCDWLQVNLDLPYLPRVVAPNLLPVLPPNPMTNVVFRQIFEYPSFHDEQIPRMDKILESYYTWKENAMILTDVEEHHDAQIEEVIKQAHDVAKEIRKVHAKKKLQEARDRASRESQHATEIFREMRDAEKKRFQEFEERKNELKQKGNREWLQYQESKKGPLPCVHDPYDYVQTKGPCKPNSHVRLCYFKCEEGLWYFFSLQYQQWLMTNQRWCTWSVEALPPFSSSYQGSNYSHGSGEYDGPTNLDEVPCLAPRLQDEMFPKEPAPCLLSEWMRELETKQNDDEDDIEGKMCWEVIKPERKLLGPADWTPCFLAGFDEKQEDLGANEKNDQQPETIKEAHLALVVEEVIEKCHVKGEEMGAKFPLPYLHPLWSIPVGEEWEINHEAIQRQLELIPNFPGLRKSEWHKNKNYLDVNLGTLLCANISSVGALHKRPCPPKDWSHQFLVVPDILDFGTTMYGAISMKVLFLQNCHGTEPGRFRFENLGPNIKFLCKLGMVPPGLSRAVRIFFRASTLGCFNHEIHIVTQYDVFRFPIFAKVVQPYPIG